MTDDEYSDRWAIYCRDATTWLASTDCLIVLAIALELFGYPVPALLAMPAATLAYFVWRARLARMLAFHESFVAERRRLAGLE